jgi:hypothetical protein
MRDLNVSEINAVNGGILEDAPTPIYAPAQSAAYLQRLFEQLSKQN